MNKVVVITDTSSAISKVLAKIYGIKVMPLYGINFLLLLVTPRLFSPP